LPQASSSGGFLRAFAVLSLASVGVGCWAAAGHGLPTTVWARNPIAWAVGLALALLAARTAGGAVALSGFLLAAPIGLAITLLSPGLSGVHRWAQAGPLQVNLAEVLLPAGTVAFAALSPDRAWSWLVAAVIMALVIAQPDASQATALGGALVATLAPWRLGAGLRWGGAAAVLAAVVAAWLRPDPLAPVAEVEGIFGLAWALSPILALAGGAALTAAAVSPMLAGRSADPAARTAAVALSVYLLLSAITPALGAFPVPLVGMGVSPILGAWLGAGLLAALASGQRGPSPSP
jgi:hypothetical protein